MGLPARGAADHSDVLDVRLRPRVLNLRAPARPRVVCGDRQRQPDGKGWQPGRERGVDGD